MNGPIPTPRVESLSAPLDEQQVRLLVEQVLQSVADGVTVHTREGRLVYVNDAGARLSGFRSAAEMLSCPPEEVRSRFALLDADGRPVRWEDLPGRRAFDGSPHHATLRVRNLVTGETRWSAVSATPVRDGRGQISLAANVFRDITDEKRDEEAWRFLAEASAVLGSSLELGTTLAAVARLAVPAMADWCSVDMLTEGGLLERIAVAHVDPEKVALAHEVRRRWPPDPEEDAPHRVVRTGKSEMVPEITAAMLDAAPLPPELRALYKELGLRSVMIVPLVVRGVGAGAISFISAESVRLFGPADLRVAEEIARRAALAIENGQLYAEAKTAIEVRDRFLSIASHELKTPLTSLTLMASGLTRAARSGKIAALTPEKLLRRIETFEEQLDRLSGLVDDLLDVSRINAGRLQLERAAVDLVPLCEDVLGRFEQAGANARCPLSLVASGPVVGAFDLGRIDQVVTNLVANAVKYGAGAPVVVSVAARGGTAELVVKDGGPGIPEGDRERVFRLFERAASANYGGLGVGLWIVRHIVEAHGGTVTIDGGAGPGTSFVVRLPLAAGQ